jgi:hypothetical protein
MENLKKRIKKLEEERQPVAAVPSPTPIQEISAEEWNAVYAPMIQAAYDQSCRAKTGSDSSH